MRGARCVRWHTSPHTRRLMRAHQRRSGACGAAAIAYAREKRTVTRTKAVEGGGGAETRRSTTRSTTATARRARPLRARPHPHTGKKIREAARPNHFAAHARRRCGLVRTPARGGEELRPSSCTPFGNLADTESWVEKVGRNRSRDHGGALVSGRASPAHGLRTPSTR